ncbi:MAG: hypothetical protein LBK06_04375 [Planctomycetaceae bacterium]|nr:hypothetical protein [Planctomycetaceae bacterium]
MMYTEAGKAIGFALEQSLHVVALPCSALRISKRLQHSVHLQVCNFCDCYFNFVIFFAVTFFILCEYFLIWR